MRSPYAWARRRLFCFVVPSWAASGVTLLDFELQFHLFSTFKLHKSFFNEKCNHIPVCSFNLVAANSIDAFSEAKTSREKSTRTTRQKCNWDNKKLHRPVIIVSSHLSTSVITVREVQFRLNLNPYSPDQDPLTWIDQH